MNTLVCILIDPTDGREVLRVTTTLVKPFGDIVNDGSGPLWERLDDAIAALEQGGGHYDRTYACARCGSGTETDGCPGCGTAFPYDGVRTGGGPSVGHEPEDFVTHHCKHYFEIDPEDAREAETERWAAQRLVESA